MSDEAADTSKIPDPDVMTVVAAMRSELMRQYNAGEISWYDAGDDDFVTIDGNPNLAELARAVIRELKTYAYNTFT